VDWADLVDAAADLGTNKIGVWAYGPSGVQGQSPWPFSANPFAKTIREQFRRRRLSFETILQPAGDKPEHNGNHSTK
jgi:hypothetical protein